VTIEATMNRITTRKPVISLPNSGKRILERGRRTGGGPGTVDSGVV